MVTNYYNASNHFTKPIRKEPMPYQSTAKSPKETCSAREEKPCEKKQAIRRPIGTDGDTTLLCGLLLFLFVSGCRDKWLLMALLYLVLF